MTKQEFRLTADIICTGKKISKDIIPQCTDSLWVTKFTNFSIDSATLHLLHNYFTANNVSFMNFVVETITNWYIIV